MKEPELIAEAEKARVGMSPRSPEGLERITAAPYQTSPALIEAVQKLLPNMN